MNWRRIVWLLALVTLPTLAEETPLQLVLRGAQHDQLYQLSSSGVTKVSALPDTLTTPLGSLWKLYVYAWLEDTHQPEQPYQCRGNSPEEVYCCQAGESITRDTALVRSCGLYFAPQRLHIGADVWGQYWQQRQAPAWLASLTTLKPETSVTVKSLLDSLATLPAQNKAQEVLLDVVLDEATAYIDPENEAVVQQAVGKLVAGKTVLVIAHRLSTITGADQIVVVNGGRSQDVGTHGELLKNCPLYQEMWRAHMGAKEGEQA